MVMLKSGSQSMVICK